MKSKISLKWSLVILGVVGVTCSSMIIFIVEDFHANPMSPASSPAPQELQQARPGLPVRLAIPAINIDAAIEDVGLTPQGTMGVPAGPTSTAWFDLGPRPGENGSAVIAGHEGWKDGVRAIFDDLYKLRAGDKIYVESEQNTVITFVVRGAQTYDQDGNAENVFNSNDGKAHLNLITCEGTWNAVQKSYSNRLVVFADKE